MGKPIPKKPTAVFDYITDTYNHSLEVIINQSKLNHNYIKK